jgi:hypothetical protein
VVAARGLVVALAFSTVASFAVLAAFGPSAALYGLVVAVGIASSLFKGERRRFDSCVLSFFIA